MNSAVVWAAPAAGLACAVLVVLAAGALAFAALVVPRRARDEALTADAYAATRTAGAAATAWVVAAVAMVPLSAADATGQSLGEVWAVPPGLVDATEEPKAWLCVAAAAMVVEAADVVLVREDLAIVPDTIVLAARTSRTIRGNLAWAFGYNVAALPVAALGLLNPLTAGAAMSLSSLLVVTKSLRLRGFRASGRGANQPQE